MDFLDSGRYTFKDGTTITFLCCVFIFASNYGQRMIMEMEERGEKKTVIATALIEELNSDKGLSPQHVARMGVLCPFFNYNYEARCVVMKVSRHAPRAMRATRLTQLRAMRALATVERRRVVLDYQPLLGNRLRRQRRCEHGRLRQAAHRQALSARHRPSRAQRAG